MLLFKQDDFSYILGTTFSIRKFGRKMEFLFVTKYFSFQRSVLLLRFTILIAQLEISYGSLQAGELSELNGTATHQRNATINTLSTTTTALVRSTDKHAFGPETENSTVTEKSEHINDWEQLINNNETRVLNSDSASDNIISITNQTFNEPVGNTTEYSLNGTSSSDTFFHNAVSVTFVSIGFTVAFLNISVIIVTFSTRKLRQNTYLNLILTLSVSDFIFGLTTLLTGIRRLSNLLSKIKELCILSNLIVPTCFLASLYQMFLISLHRYLVISGSDLSKKLFKQKRKYIWYMACWVVQIVPLSFFVSPLPTEVDHTCSTDTVFYENRYIVFCIMVIPEAVCIFLIIVFYCSAMFSLKKNYLNVKKSTLSDRILENKREKFLKSMKSVSVLLLALLVFSGPMIVRNFLSISDVANQESLLITFPLTNINSLLNPLIYFTNIVEFKDALKRPCSGL